MSLKISSVALFRNGLVTPTGLIRLLAMYLSGAMIVWLVRLTVHRLRR